jgi:diguanylate cyclase (GGDEF)-like protein
MSDAQNDKQNALTPSSTEARTALVSRGLTDLFHSRRLAALEAINLISRHVIVALFDQDELLAIICQQLFEVNNWLSVDHVVVSLAKENELRVRAQQGRLIPSTNVGDKIAEAGAATLRSLSIQRSVIENDLSGISGSIPICSGAQSEMCVPIVYFGEMLGTLTLDCSRKYAFFPEDVEAVEALADVCAAAIQNAYYFDRLKQLAYTDHLTGVYNRRYFEMRIIEELERAKRFDGRLSLVIADIDVFSSLNGEFGSELGDEVLRACATVMGQKLRKVDFVSRYGQDDFAIVMPETNFENGVRVSEMLRLAIESHHFAGVPRPVTISCGVADYPTHGRTRDELFAAADGAMYIAKSTGRNRVAAAR